MDPSVLLWVFGFWVGLGYTHSQSHLHVATKMVNSVLLRVSACMHQNKRPHPVMQIIENKCIDKQRQKLVVQITTCGDK